MSFYDEPQQKPHTGHVLGDSTSRVWREVKDKQSSKTALVLSTVSWCCFSALAFKLVRVLVAVYSPTVVSIAGFIVLAPLSMLLYVYWQTHEHRFNSLVWFAVVILGFILGGL